MEYIYDESKFDSLSKETIRLAIDHGADEKILDIMTSLNKNGRQAYSYAELYQILKGEECGMTILEINKYAKLNEDLYSVYNCAQMDCIRQAIIDGLSDEQLNLLMTLNKFGNPVYSGEEMSQILCSMNDNFALDEIKLFTKLNNREMPIYDAGQMGVIRYGLKHGLSKNSIEMFSKLDFNDKPIYDSHQMKIICTGLVDGMTKSEIEIFLNPKFSGKEMGGIKSYIKQANEKQVQQIKECIKDGLSFEQFYIFMNKKIPAENIRVFRSLYELGCNRYTIKCYLEKGYTYEELKEIKYMTKCSKELDFIITLNRKNFDIDLVRELSIAEICKNNKLGLEFYDSIKYCITNRMPPEQIKFIAESDFSREEMKCVAIALLNGANFEEVKFNYKLGKDVLNNGSILLAVNEYDFEEIR